MTSTNLDNIHAPLFDPSAWKNMDSIHAIFAMMRRETPVHLGSHPGFPDLWHATKYEDIFEIERRADTFLNAPRLIIMETARENAVRRITGGGTDLVEKGALIRTGECRYERYRLADAPAVLYK